MKLDRYITIQQPTITRGTSGEEIHSWTDYGTCWAAMENSSGREYVESDRLLTAYDVRFTIRYNERVHSGMRIIYKHRYYNIISVTEMGRYDFLNLNCETTDVEQPFTVDINSITADSSVYTADQITW